MNSEYLGVILMGVGGVVAWGTAGIPPGGFSQFSQLLEAYRVAKETGEKPTDDARMAYLQLRCYQVGGCLFLVGFLTYAFSKVWS